MNKPGMIATRDDVELGCGPLDGQYYREGAQDLVRRMVPAAILEAPLEDQLDARIRFNDLLPMVQTSELQHAPCLVSIQLLCKQRQGACQFFYEMVSRWLLGQKKVHVDLYFSSDVRLPALCEDLLSVAEMVIQIKSTQELEEVRRNLKQIETEIRLGVVSHYHARRIMEFKGLSHDGKTAMIQEKIGSLIQSRSKEYDRGIFSQMQHFLVTCREEFKSLRDYHHISRIISNLYSVRKVLKQNIDVWPASRHVIVKFLKTRLASPKKGEAGRPVLGILAGLNFLKEHEMFEKRHLIEAVSRYLPGVAAVEESSFVNQGQGSAIQTIYLEIEKKDGSDFSHEEIQLLREKLPQYLKAHVEQLTYPVFMPRNEEEVLKNIMALSRQLRFVTDLPQVVISFDEQRSEELCFTVVLLRVIGTDAASIVELFSRAGSTLPVVPDRIRRLGALGRKHCKEATVFRTRVPSRSFLRADHSLDLYKARRHVLSALSSVLGEVRDYNGGMIGKQNEVLVALKRSLGKTAEPHALLVEKFFYALAPVELRSVMEVEHLKQLFLLLLQAQKSGREWLYKQEEKRVFAILSPLDPAAVGRLTAVVEGLQLPLISFVLDQSEGASAGFLLQSDNAADQKRFLDAMNQVG